MLLTTFTSIAAVALNIAGALAAKSAGCGKTATIKSGTQPELKINGKSRQWIVRLPNNYDSSRAYRLIFTFHWQDGSHTAVDQDNYFSVRPLDTNNSAIFVAPNGLNKGWGNSGGDDITFVKTMMSTIEDDLCVETTQRYSMGFSYGGAMTYALTCAIGDQIRAVAIMSGATLSGCSGGGPKTSVAAYVQHGTVDSVLAISNGRNIRDAYVKANGCTAQSPQEPGSGAKHITTDYKGCKQGFPVQWTAFADTHYGTPKENGVMWTPKAIWTFWSQFFDS